MDYADYTKQQLLERIRSLEMLNQELLKEQKQQTRLDYAWTGNLGHWYWDITSNEVTFNPLKITTLGYEKHEIPKHVTYHFFTEKLHPEDYQQTMDSMLDHLFGKAEVYEVEYRIQAKDGNYKWFYDRGKITQYDENGKPLFLAGIVFDVTEEKELLLELEQRNQVLWERSSLDALTNISNRRALIEHLQAELVNSSCTKAPLSIAIFDIDDFKTINDCKGHVCGDHVLAEVASVIIDNIRSTDLVGRYGGEEFLVVFLDTTLIGAAKIAERIREAVEEHHFPEGLRVTISGGVKQYEGESLSELIRAADRHLYKSKRSGKNQVIF